MAYIMRKKGQALLETILVLPILLFLLCAIIDVGRILHTSIELDLVTQEAVRKAALGEKDTSIIYFVHNKVDLNSKESMVVNIIPKDIERESGDYVTVNIIYPIKYITPIMNVFLPSPFQVDTKSTIRIE